MIGRVCLRETTPDTETDLETTREKDRETERKTLLNEYAKIDSGMFAFLFSGNSHPRSSKS